MRKKEKRSCLLMMQGDEYGTIPLPTIKGFGYIWTVDIDKQIKSR